MKLRAIVLLSLASMAQAGSLMEATAEEARTPQSASCLGEPIRLTADQVYGTVLTLRSEASQTTSNQGRGVVSYRWFVRNTLDQVIFIAVPRTHPAPRNFGYVYGATWVANSLDYTLSADSLYYVQTKDGAGWRESQGLPYDQSRDVQWVPLQPEQEREIYHRLVPSNKPLEAVLFAVPFRVNELPGKALLCFTNHGL